MAILRRRETWKRAVPRALDRACDLTPEEREHVRAALHYLRAQHGSWEKLGAAMGAKWKTLQAATGKRGSVGAGLALRASRLARVPLETILSGGWPEKCPACGRHDISS